MFGLAVRFTLKDEDSASGFDVLVGETLPHIRESEPGTLVYAVHQVEGKPLERYFYELYRDPAAFDEHEEQPHVKRFLEARGAFLDSVEVDFLSLQGAKGVAG
ncbi:antibiotic biosynthesis monooxygenase [Streptomonospora sp. S1-112]|uniref:Antibiotic biosynthesis monooxygenase n=1 Tax=Streptomonospora mangrovi TaxID=2883123 RepID=A0A9X3NMU5_9ACTN|nr:antibiotic biosynthesis monooxygenase [Streptomonospora mangrovi]MDA0564931.1 antibiotic biosynthesis monooxygenase [Streptomonospora mangrovi]